MRPLICAALLLASSAQADTLQQRTEERHVATGDVLAHVLPDGTAYAVQGSTVLPLTPADVRITNSRATIRLPDGDRSCPLPLDALDERCAVVRSRTGRALRVVEKTSLQTWVTDACVVWQATDHTTITTKGP